MDEYINDYIVHEGVGEKKFEEKLRYLYIKLQS